MQKGLADQKYYRNHRHVAEFFCGCNEKKKKKRKNNSFIHGSLKKLTFSMQETRPQMNVYTILILCLS